ncbi:MAG: SDR family NAD(P)-dependent oxidoreductase [Planctomycetaceae bacterium]|nr:SDR family NAD(P)-dependent oxidoreductase [Planctomycetaceae bacterium]
MKAVILGASRGMGRALARQLAARGDRLFLLGRDVEQLRFSAQDLEIRGAAAPVGLSHCDLSDPSGFATALDEAWRQLDGVDAVVVTAGLFADQETLENDPEATARLLTVDFTNTVLFCEEARRRLLASGGGTLCAFSSVAGDRGRKPVVLYGAAKAGLARYLEGLDHRFRRQGLKTVCVKPGFVRTGMTAGLKPPPFAGDPDQVARRIRKAIDRGRPVVYAPRPWRYVMQVIRHLPRFVMRRVKF